MASINKDIAEQIISNKGHYFDDPKVCKVLVYTTPEGEEQHAIVYPHEDRMRYEESPWCLNVRVLWEDSDEQ